MKHRETTERRCGAARRTSMWSPAAAGVLLLLALGACAVPVPPSGGPPDRTPPGLVRAEPAPGSTRFAGDRVRLVFDEYVDVATLPRALGITPEAGRLRFDWRGRRVDIVFEDGLRDSTTYILTLDDALRDTRGVALEAPITLAFATGDRIDRGRLAGRVIDARTGRPAAGADVLAYARPDSTLPATLPPAPDYRTQTDAEGRFAFEYLSERPYFVAALRDADRDGVPDPGEALAVPPRALVRADTAGTPVSRPWLLARADTTRPAPVRAVPVSARRLEVRFSEPVQPAAGAGAWEVADTASGAAYAVRARYVVQREPRSLWLVTDSLPARPLVLDVAMGAAQDSSGNPSRPERLRFSAPSRADTARARFVGFEPDTLGRSPIHLPPRTHVVLRWSSPPDTAQLAAVVVADTAGMPVPYAWADVDGTGVRLLPGEVAGPFDVEVPVGDTVRVRRFVRLGARALGELSGVVAADATAVVQLFPAAAAPDAAPLREQRAEGGRYRFAELPAGRYRLRAFADRDDDGAWDAGGLVPYRPAEPVAWSGDTLRVRARWETVVDDTLRVE